ncbi:MAG: polyprenyl synthetase family protein [Oscillospiraceae bacterium]|nr:polyprenyl synthetase family protein [Oscillospiraceae bacterium]
MVKEQLEYYAELTEAALEGYLPETQCLQKNVILAARHSLKAGGKRIRPALVMEFCRVCGGEPEDALPVACAIEMMHTFSLIHDDLPCMDDDDMRRGQPSCHKAYGEANALLAGDALAMLPYQIIAQAALKKRMEQTAALKIISLLGESAGIFGMIGGQVIDTENEGRQLPVNILLEMYRMKTGALLDFCCRAGCIAAGAGADKQLAAGDYAKKLGLAFQIIDDILDVTADEKLLGKPVGSDADSGKFTYVTAVGLDEARAEAERLTAQALKVLDAFEDTEFLRGLTDMLLKRNY